MEDYYEILEVNKKASQEVIEKAYKVLAKKYHPDMHQGPDKAWAEEQFKKVSGAYEILSNEEKRKEYDEEISQAAEEYAEQNTYSNEQNYNTQDQQQGNYTPQTQQNYEEEEEYRRQQEEEDRIIEEQRYNRAYNDYLRSLGFRLKEPFTMKKFLTIVISVAVIIILFIIIWLIPPFRKSLIELYNGNPIIKALVDVILSIFGKK